MYHIDAVPNPAFHFDADAHPNFPFDAYPDPTFHFDADQYPHQLVTINLKTIQGAIVSIYGFRVHLHGSMKAP
jgi:hypothetical protein